MRLLTVVILALTILSVLAISGCTSVVQGPQPSGSVSPLESRQNSDGGVTVTAVYEGNGTFNIKLDTHSGSLDYPLDKLAHVKDGKGDVYDPVSWDGGSGGHHLNGTLKFPRFDDSQGFELVVKDVAGVQERVLKW